MGNNKKFILLVLSVLFILSYVFLPSLYVDACYESHTLREKKAEKMSVHYDGITFFGRTDYVGKGMIHCIAVSEKGLFAIAFSDKHSMKHTVLYNSEGNVLFHMAFEEAGSVRLDFDTSGVFLSIYIVRSKIQLVMDHNGELVDVFSLNEIPKVIFDTGGTESFTKSIGNNLISYSANLFERSVTVSKSGNIVFFRKTNTFAWKPVVLGGISLFIAFSLYCWKQRKRLGTGDGDVLGNGSV